jgi:hypothetical protein
LAPTCGRIRSPQNSQRRPRSRRIKSCPVTEVNERDMGPVPVKAQLSSWRVGGLLGGGAGCVNQAEARAMWYGRGHTGRREEFS